MADGRWKQALVGALIVSILGVWLGVWLGAAPALAQTLPASVADPVKAADAEKVATAADAVGKGGRLSDMCPRINRGSLSVCHSYIEHHFPGQADILSALHIAVDQHKDKARQQYTHTREWTLFIQVGLIGLGFLTTMFAAIARTYRDPQYRYRNILGLLPIVTSALVTLVSGFQTVYQFDTRQELHRSVGDDLARLQSDIHYRLLVEATSSQKPFVSQELLDRWKLRLDDVLSTYTSGASAAKAKPDLTNEPDMRKSN